MMSSADKHLVYSLKDLESFAKSQDWAEHYKAYSWGEDSWENGFPGILGLELELTKAAGRNYIKKEHIIKISSWARLKNLQKMECPETFTLTTKTDVDLAEVLKRMKFYVKGLGPASMSKVIRFAFPAYAGAIDTRLVRVFGMGDPDSKRHEWLNLEVANNGFGWQIPEAQAAWPSDYLRWINILRYLASALNTAGVQCPHPDSFPTSGLRVKGKWLCADVEMALFAYATKELSQPNSRF